MLIQYSYDINEMLNASSSLSGRVSWIEKDGNRPGRRNDLDVRRVPHFLFLGHLPMRVCTPNSNVFFFPPLTFLKEAFLVLDLVSDDPNHLHFRNEESPRSWNHQYGYRFRRCHSAYANCIETQTSISAADHCPGTLWRRDRYYMCRCCTDLLSIPIKNQLG